MATSITSPSLSNAIRIDVPAINTILKALAKSDPSVLADIENGTKRIYQDANTKVWSIQEYQSGSWVSLTSFNIDAKSVDGKTLSTGATANAIALRDADGKLTGDITGNAATATTATALASTLAVAGGGTGATTAAAARTNLDVPPTSHASTGTSYGVSTDANYGHAKASATAPKALGTAAVGSETASFARGDHVHPTTTATDSVLGMVKLSDSTTSTSDASAGIAASPAAVKAAMDKADSASTAANNAQTAVGNAISGLSVSGKVITYTKGDGTTGTITTQDTNTTYSAMKAATSSAAGAAGLVPAPAAGAQSKFLRGDATWQTISSYTGTLSSKYNGNVSVTASGKAYTVSGLTAYKPMYVQVYHVSGDSGKVAYMKVTNLLGQVPTEYYLGNYEHWADDVIRTYEWKVLIPTATSVVCTFRYAAGETFKLIVYQ